MLHIVCTKHPHLNVTGFIMFHSFLLYVWLAQWISTGLLHISAAIFEFNTIVLDQTFFLHILHCKSDLDL